MAENYEDIMKIEGKEEWLQAMKEEIKSLEQQRVWELVARNNKMSYK